MIYTKDIHHLDTNAIEHSDVPIYEYKFAMPNKYEENISIIHNDVKDTAVDNKALNWYAVIFYDNNNSAYSIFAFRLNIDGIFATLNSMELKPLSYLYSTDLINLMYWFKMTYDKD